MTDDKLYRRFGAAHPGGTVGVYSEATMLFEGAGTYVLTAVTAFMAGVVITAALLRKRYREQNNTRM